ncbi:hypothetical protein DTO021D3_43 [Paecilomyces variotii]|nr:hypothetical protein DTO032I3_43 [Paecilomyces variotii]KAJ9282706.1 hypothetical protein DTO021D3_43 [Paecilomyces variotii]KAJ9343952.1 hypothetical protein DTO027B6_3388 [Paecilomyces variotii]KAJ9393742.1 hypothetical protein DTO032I4_513 [Paecilomyces variotii]
MVEFPKLMFLPRRDSSFTSAFFTDIDCSLFLVASNGFAKIMDALRWIKLVLAFAGTATRLQHHGEYYPLLQRLGSSVAPVALAATARAAVSIPDGDLARAY